MGVPVCAGHAGKTFVFLKGSVHMWNSKTIILFIENAESVALGISTVRCLRKRARLAFRSPLGPGASLLTQNSLSAFLSFCFHLEARFLVSSGICLCACVFCYLIKCTV